MESFCIARSLVAGRCPFLGLRVRTPRRATEDTRRREGGVAEPILCKKCKWDILSATLVGARTPIASGALPSTSLWKTRNASGPGESEVARQDASEAICERRPVKEVGRHLTHVDPLRIVHVLVDDRGSGGWRCNDWRAASAATWPAPQFLSAGILCLAVGHGLYDVGSRLFG